MDTDLVVRNATIVSPEGRVQGDLLVSGGRVAGIVAPGAGQAAQVVDAAGLYMLPGAVDPHVHMMDPGLTEKEDFITGTGAAAVGGVTTVVEHHRSIPFVLDAKTLKDKINYLATRALIDYALFGGFQPDNIDQLEPMWRAGAAAFKAFTCNLHGAPAVLADKMLEGFKVLARFDGLCLVHCEDEFITAANEARLKAAERKDFCVIPNGAAARRNRWRWRPRLCSRAAQARASSLPMRVIPPSSTSSTASARRARSCGWNRVPSISI